MTEPRDGKAWKRNALPRDPEPEAAVDDRRGPCGAPWSWHETHDRYVDVDDMNVVYTACFVNDGETIWGDATIHGETTPERADAVRRAAQAYREGRGTKPGLPR